MTTSPQYAMSYSFEMPALYRGCAIKVIVDPDHHLLEATRDNNEVIVQTSPAAGAGPRRVLWAEKFTAVRTRATRPRGVRRARGLHEHRHGSTRAIRRAARTTSRGPATSPSLAPGQQHTFDSPVVHPYKDFLTAIADVNHQVRESNENNNIWTP